MKIDARCPFSQGVGENQHVAAAYGRGGEIPDLELVATMKFTGQNTLCYPVCWYGGSWARSTRRART